MTNSSVAVISTRCRSVSPSASGPSKIRACSLGVDAAAARQPPVLLQFVLAVAQMADPQDDQFGVLARQLARRPSSIPEYGSHARNSSWC